jgi:hypothetical protein
VEYELNGLEPDNFLAFLALLGTLRILDRKRPEWNAGVRWHGVPLRPALQLDVELPFVDLVEELARGIAAFSTEYTFDAQDIKFTTAEFRKLALHARRSTRIRADLVAALASDGAVKRASDDTVEATVLCTMLGSGHQHFLTRLANATTGPVDRGVLLDALTTPWTYSDPGESLRWDPIEDRRYAYQAGDPSEQRHKIGVVAGANRLAALGFSVWTCAPGPHGLLCRGVRGIRGPRNLAWPLVDRFAGLAAHAALLAHPVLIGRGAPGELAAYGVSHIARATRYQVGKYFNISRGTVTATRADWRDREGRLLEV